MSRTLDWSKAKERDRLRSAPRSATTHEGASKRLNGFTAKYTSDCVLCDERIHPGDQIRFWSRPTVAHVDCVNQHT